MALPFVNGNLVVGLGVAEEGDGAPLTLCHPDILDFGPGNTWAGHRWWCIGTTDGINVTEAPYLFSSDNADNGAGGDWTCRLQVDAFGVLGFSGSADAAIAYNGDIQPGANTGNLKAFWQREGWDGENAVNTCGLVQALISSSLVVSSIEHITSEPAALNSSVGNIYNDFLSPAPIRKPDGSWCMWGCSDADHDSYDDYQIYFKSSPDGGANNWTTKQVCSFNVVQNAYGGRQPWHIDATLNPFIPGRVELIIACSAVGEPAGAVTNKGIVLIHAHTTLDHPTTVLVRSDSPTYLLDASAGTGWDSFGLYKSTGLLRKTGNDVILDLWYDGYDEAAFDNIGFTSGVLFTIWISIDAVDPIVHSLPAISGTRVAGTSVQGVSGATFGAISYPTSTTWSMAVSGLVLGDNTITVRALQAGVEVGTDAVTVTYSAVPIISASNITTNGFDLLVVDTDNVFSSFLVYKDGVRWNVIDMDSATSDTVQDGSVYTLLTSAGHFGATGPNVILFDDFEGGTVGQPIRTGAGSAVIGQWTSIDSDGDVKYASDNPHSGTKCFKSINPFDPGVDDSPNNAMHAQLSGDPTELLVSWWCHVPTTAPFPGEDGYGPHAGGSLNWKLIWLMQDMSTVLHDQDVLMVSDPHNFYITGNDPSNGGLNQWETADYFPISDVAKGVWMHFKWYEKGSSNATGVEKLWKLGSSGLSLKYGATGITNMSAGQYRRYINVNAYQRKFQSGTHAVQMFDDIYVASGPGAQARVEIGDNATYSACTNLAQCTTSAWADGSISVTIRKGSFPSGTAWLHVINASGTVAKSKQVVIS